MNKFKIGDRVKYVDNSDFGDTEWNPLYNGKYGQIIGTVYEINESRLGVHVKWDNEEVNIYYNHNLELYVNPIILPDELFEM